MRDAIERKLATYAKKVLERQRPSVIGITGSVGKSSTKQAIGAVLGSRFGIRVSPKNYNTEIGLPLSVLGLESGDSSKSRWVKTMMKAWMIATFGQKGYPELLVLEMAADRPGDIRKLTDIAPPDIAVVTAVGESHAEKFGDVATIAKEKRTLVESLDPSGAAVLNRDDEIVWAMRNEAKGEVVSFGFHEGADVRAHEVSMNYACGADGVCGMHFKLSADGSTLPVFIPHVVGKTAIYSALAATAVGKVKAMNLVEITDGLRKYEPPPGRLRIIPGIKRTTLIDDTYNAAPKSVHAALSALQDVPLGEENRRFAVLGDMLELGSLSEEAHKEIGAAAAASDVDYLVLVGELMGDAKNGALEVGMSEDQVYHFANVGEAGRFVQSKMKEGDVVLVKGSRGMQMELVVKELMADPLSAWRLLCGDHPEWRV